MKSSKVQRAYGQLLCLIEDGAEYPDAVYRVTDEFHLSESQVAALERKYDSEPTGRAADEWCEGSGGDAVLDRMVS